MNLNKILCYLLSLAKNGHLYIYIQGISQFAGWIGFKTFMAKIFKFSLFQGKPWTDYIHNISEYVRFIYTCINKSPFHLYIFSLSEIKIGDSCNSFCHLLLECTQVSMNYFIYLFITFWCRQECQLPSRLCR